MDRGTAKTTFLTQAGWQGGEIQTLAGDASNRRYDRLTLGARPVVLMDAPPETGERIGTFISVAQHLHSLGLHAPEILAADTAQGFLLLEDLGDGLYAHLFETDPDQQVPLYRDALAVLKRLHEGGQADLPAYGATEMAEAAKLAPIWYAGTPDLAAPLAKSMGAALDRLDWSRPVPVLRDYHAENLIWCPDEFALARVGLLDFQDAALGHPVYDVASLFYDARRDVPAPVVAELRAQVSDWFATDLATFDQAIAILTAQRALRILGVFARLSLHFGKPSYIDLIPRVWGQLAESLRHPDLAELRGIVASTLPPPSAEHLSDLKARAGTCPTR